MKKLFYLVFLIICTIIITGCEPKREILKHSGKYLSINFKVKKGHSYKISTDRVDFVTSREKAILIGKKFKIGIEEDDNLSLPAYGGDFAKYMKHYSKENEFKKVVFSNIHGFQKYYDYYVRYEVFLPVNDKYVLKLNIYPDDNTPKMAKKAFNSEEVQDILNHISVKEK